MALPLKPSTVRGPPHLLPRYLELELSRHMLRNIALFRLRAHTLSVETGCWQIHKRLCDKCHTFFSSAVFLEAFIAQAACGFSPTLLVLNIFLFASSQKSS